MGVILHFLLTAFALAASPDPLATELAVKFGVTETAIDPRILTAEFRPLWQEVAKKVRFPKKNARLYARGAPPQEFAKALPDAYVKRIPIPLAWLVASYSERASKEPDVLDFLARARELAASERKAYDSLLANACAEGTAGRPVRQGAYSLYAVRAGNACLPVYLGAEASGTAFDFFSNRRERLLLRGEAMREPVGAACELDPAPGTRPLKKELELEPTTIAIIDSGIDYNHGGLRAGLAVASESREEALARLTKLAADSSSARQQESLARFRAEPERLLGIGWDFLEHSNLPMDYFENEANSLGWMKVGGGHGSHVAGIARGNASYLRLLPIRMIGQGKERKNGAELREKDPYTLAYDAIALASLRGARVANISMEGFSERGAGFVDSIEDHPELAVVVAAGNGGLEITRYAIPLQSLLAPNLLRVAGLRADGLELHRESNYGAAFVDVATPEENISSCLVGGISGRLTGTSMAAPRAAHLLATLFAIDPLLTPAAAKEIICSTATPLPGLKGKVRCGALNEQGAIEKARELRASRP